LEIVERGTVVDEIVDLGIDVEFVGGFDVGIPVRDPNGRLIGNGIIQGL
jgi:hypothetical protein